MGWTTIQSQNLGEANLHRKNVLAALISGVGTGVTQGMAMKEKIDQANMKKDLGDLGDVTDGGVAAGATETTDADGSTSFVGADGQAGAPMASGFKFNGREYASRGDAEAAQLAAQQGVMRRYGDIAGASQIGRDAQQARLAGIQVEEAGHNKDLRERRAKVDRDVAEYVRSNTQLAEDGKTVVSAPSQIDVLNRRRDAFVDAGLVDDAIATHKQGRDMFVQDWEINKAKRSQEIDAAVADAKAGSWDKAAAIYKMIPDGVDVENVVSDRASMTKEGRVPVYGDVIKDGKKTGQRQFLGYEDELIKGIYGAKDASTAVAMVDNAFAQRMQETEAARRERETKSHERSAASTAALHGAQIGQIQQKTRDAQDLAAIRSEIEDAITRKDPKAEAAGRSKLSMYLRQGRGAGNDMTAEEKVAHAYMAANPGMSYAQALDKAREKKTMSAKDFHAETVRDLMKTRMMSAPDADKEATAATALVYGQNWRSGSGGAPAKSAGQSPYPDGTKLKGKDGKNYVVKNGVPVPQ